jgi:hypothetical protein
MSIDDGSYVVLSADGDVWIFSEKYFLKHYEEYK